jgi:hypothetical protein
LDNPFAAILERSLGKQPRRLTPYHQYLKMYYEERIKDEYTWRFEAATKKYNEATASAADEDDESEFVPELSALKIRNEVGREFWDLEPDKLHEEVAQAAEDAHAKEVKEWEDSKLIAKTPQQYHQ